MAVGAHAQLGQTGIVMPDGNNVQFTHDQAENILLIGSSGAITADGKHVQLDRDGLPVTRTKRAVLLEGPSGVLFEDGQKRHLPPGVEIVLMSEAGAVLSNGENVQFRKKRDVLLEGPSGVLFKDGQKRHLPPGVEIVLMSETGAVLSNGENVQFRKKRSSPLIDSIKGPSGYVTPTGQLFQLPPGVEVVIEGHSGALLSDGTAIQFFE
ncbi:Cuticle protein CP459 [Portunus trituberculatus]|uniref:Cuticle protein CP459 n=2 Tax=Portunus trituberculatus TaxID=210409 RepID=A0A5B7F7G4_PORTR|nr:Cuticle protein CP459 [Portunus trituberculatus]